MGLLLLLFVTVKLLANLPQWSRLIGGSRSLTSKGFRATTPTERLTAFKRTCNTLLVSLWPRGIASMSGQSRGTKKSLTELANLADE